MSKVSQVEVFRTDIPFKRPFYHALKKRDVSESVFVKITLDDGITGYGESLPRVYVSGNTRDFVFTALCSYAGSLKEMDLANIEKGIGLIKGLSGLEGEGRCAIEIALLDCLGKTSLKPVSELISPGPKVKRRLDYSMVISGESIPKAALIGLFARMQGYKFIKVKVGLDNDVARVRLIRQVSGNADIRVDANGAWDAATAIDMIKKMRPFNISCIEQPTPKGDMEAMQEVADFCPEPVMADESLCTAKDAVSLAAARACDMFNVRLSKCGGIFRSLDIIKIAEENGIGYQIGCHVGESGILSAAARHLAAVAKHPKYLEGGYSRFLLKDDVVEEDLTPERGVGYNLDGNGLGVTVNEDVVRKYSKENFVVS